MENLTIHSDLINKKIEIIYGFKVDYNSPIKNFNNNGKWGFIVNKGKIVHSINYDPNKCGVNFGESDYESKLQFMKRQLSVYQELQPNQIKNIINNNA